MVCTIFITLFAKLLNNRLYSIAANNTILWNTNYGFTKNRSCSDSILVFSRLTEDLAYYYDCNDFKKVVATLIDLRKAFPSLNWKTVQIIFQKLGIISASPGNDKFWTAIHGLHRAALYNFGKDLDPFTVDNGCKEGCVSSPTLFLVVYSCIMVAFIDKLRRQSTARGIKLRAIPDELVFNRNQCIQKLLYPSVNEIIKEFNL